MKKLDNFSEWLCIFNPDIKEYFNNFQMENKKSEQIKYKVEYQTVSPRENWENDIRKEDQKLQITNFLKQLKESDETIIHIFNNGSCYKLCKILKTLYPSANALYSREEGHWITEIDGGYYDIGGKINVQYVIDKVYENLPELEASADVPTFTNNIGVVYGKYV